METKRCRGYDREPHVEPVAAFAKNQATTRGVQKLCRECHSAAMKAHRVRMKALTPEQIAKNRSSDVKRCARCASVGRNPIRPVEDFGKSSGTADRRYRQCKDCIRELRWKQAGIIGMTIERYEAMLIAQNYRCAIPACGAAGFTQYKRSLDVDHDHETGEVRGLLCRTCNVTAGQARDDVAILADLIRYLNGDVGLKPLLK